MKSHPSIALVLHGHFYQPPRENPWTDEVPREPTAAPFANWNARVHAECYRANAYARVFGAGQHIAAIANNYASMSFNVGPTLARWIERHDDQVVRRMVDGDHDQFRRVGGGGAMAQVWGHAIAPLLSARDLHTQILWGRYDFRRRFGRDPRGMWLPETAANAETLAALIEAGVRFTVVGPEQIEAVREPGGPWQEVRSETLDAGRPYRFLHPDGSGRSIALAIFDGPLSRDLAFGSATKSASDLVEAIRKAAARSKVSGKRLVLAASDGELYGHHRKFADLTFAYAMTMLAKDPDIEVTNLEALLAEHPATFEARLRPGPNGEGTAWSCSHGLGRWRRDCGCRMVHEAGSSQAWRHPLREALDLLRDRSVDFFEDAAGDLFLSPWEARNAYGKVIDDGPSARTKLLQRLGRPSLRHNRNRSATRALVLMEMQRSLLLMYASCAWFFDDIAGPETAIGLRRAAHAMDLWERLGSRPPTRAFIAKLAEASSNNPKLGTGADAFARACRDRVTTEKVVARAAFSHLASARLDETDLPGFDVTIDCSTRDLKPRSLEGVAKVTARRMGEKSTLKFAASYDGKAGFFCRVERQRLGLDDLAPEAAQPLRFAALVRLTPEACDARACRALLEMAEKLGACSATEISALGGLFTRALVTYLAGSGSVAPPSSKKKQQPSPIDWRLALRLADRAGAVQPTDDWHRVEELVWEHLESSGRGAKAQPAALLELATRLNLLEPRWEPEAGPRHKS